MGVKWSASCASCSAVRLDGRLWVSCGMVWPIGEKICRIIAEEAFGAKYPWLRALKAKYDLKNVFEKEGMMCARWLVGASCSSHVRWC